METLACPCVRYQFDPLEEARNQPQLVSSSAEVGRVRSVKRASTDDFCDRRVLISAA
jgi:hypothetical protein